MCGGSPKVDTSVQDQMLADSRRARADEEARKARIAAGTATIDQNFAQFDTNFFDGYRDAHMGYVQPQLDAKFGDATEQLTYALSRAGTLNSSVAGQKQADLKSAYDTQLASSLSEANNAADALRGNIASEQSRLVSLLNATGDSDRAASEALARSQQLYRATPQVNSLGDIFAGISQGVGNYYAGQANQQAYDTYFGRNPSSTNSRIVR